MSTKARIHTILKTSLSLAALLGYCNVWAGDCNELGSFDTSKQKSMKSCSEPKSGLRADEYLLASRTSPYRFAGNIVASQPYEMLPWLAPKGNPSPLVPGGPLPQTVFMAQNAVASNKIYTKTSLAPLHGGFLKKVSVAHNALKTGKSVQGANLKTKLVPGGPSPEASMASQDNSFIHGFKSGTDRPAYVVEPPVTVANQDSAGMHAECVNPIPGGPIENVAFVASAMRLPDEKQTAQADQPGFLSQAALAAAHIPITAMTSVRSQNSVMPPRTEMTKASLAPETDGQSSAEAVVGEPVHFMAADETLRADAVRLNALSPASGPVPFAAVTSAPLPLLPGAIPGAVPGGGLPSTTKVVPAFSPPAPVALPNLPYTDETIPAMTPEQTAEQGLSPQSRAIASRLPPEKIRRRKKSVTLEHVQKNSLDTGDVRQHKGLGITISVRRPKANVNHMLEEAYDALIAGNQQDAIALYRQALAEEPGNKLALFGLATTYHRAGQLQMARPLYGRLLAIDPYNAEGLNNFLVLLADESPSEALEEMKRLQISHPDFSPLPAQIAVLYEKLGDYDSAIRSMKHAIDLSPENIKYRYDMAAMLDKSGDWEDAADYYQQLLQASDRGEKLPGKAQQIQERLTFIRSNKPSHP